MKRAGAGGLKTEEMPCMMCVASLRQARTRGWMRSVVSEVSSKRHTRTKGQLPSPLHVFTVL